MFGGGRFNDYTRHPDKVVRSGGYASAAAGIGQFMPGTCAGAKKALNLPDFSPASQDQALPAARRGDWWDGAVGWWGCELWGGMGCEVAHVRHRGCGDVVTTRRAAVRICARVTAAAWAAWTVRGCY